MSRVLARLSTAGVAGGAALLLAALPASAGADASMSASEPGSSRAALGAPSAKGGAISGPVGEVSGDAAASVGFTVNNLRCFSNAVVFNATTRESGRSGVQQFQQRAQLQEFAAGAWRNRTSVARSNSTRFPNDFRNFSYSREWRGNHVANNASWRVKWQGFYLNGAGRIIAQTRVITATCF